MKSSLVIREIDEKYTKLANKEKQFNFFIYFLFLLSYSLDKIYSFFFLCQNLFFPSFF